MRLVNDTSVFVAGLRSGAGASRKVLRLLLEGKHEPLMGDKLFYEYQDVASREKPWKDCALTPAQRLAAVDDFAAVCEYVRVPRVWRPNLPDEGDNHVMELALAGQAKAIVTLNTRDFAGARFAPAGLEVDTPARWMSRFC